MRGRLPGKILDWRSAADHMVRNAKVPSRYFRLRIQAGHGKPHKILPALSNQAGPATMRKPCQAPSEI